MNGGEISNPYVGLRPFEREDSLYFFGRREQTAELLELLHRHHFLAVVGSSGCGKSSLIRAGLVPALLGGFLVEQRDRWQVAAMKPEDAPLRNLAAALIASRKETEPEPEEIEELRRTLMEEHTQGWIDRVLPMLGEDGNLLLLVDQFEEVFAFRGGDDEEPRGGEPHAEPGPERRREAARRRAEAADFVALLVELGERRDLPIYTVLTMRTDFLGDCDVFYGLPEAINRGEYLVPRLTREQLREVVAGPARLSGTRLTPRLLDHLLNRLGDRSDRLPILQHALLRTWEMWRRAGGEGPIDLEHYERAGTLGQALSRHADEALREADREAAARIFKRLTDTDASRRRVRSPAHLSELVKVAGRSPAGVRKILDRFAEGGRHFVYLSAGASEEDPRVNISHESLIRQWGTLRQWVDEEREARDRFGELVRYARRRSQARWGLLRGLELDTFLDWRRDTEPTAEWAQRYSRQEDDFEVAMRYLGRSRLRQRVKQAATALVVAGLFVALVAGNLWFIKTRARVQEAAFNASFNLAQVFEEKAGAALLRAEERPETAAGEYRRAWLYSLAALSQERRLEDRLPLSLGRLLLHELQPSRRRESAVAETGSVVLALAHGGDGNLWAAGRDAEDNGVVRVWSQRPGSPPKDQRLEPQGSDQRKEFLHSAAFDPAGGRLATGWSDGSVLLWRLPSGKLEGALGSRGGLAGSLAFSPDGETLASGHQDGTVRLWEVRGRRVRWERREEPAAASDAPDPSVVSLAFSPDGVRLAAALSDGRIVLRNVVSGMGIRVLEHPDPVSLVAFAPDGERLAWASGNEVLLEGGDEPERSFEHASVVRSLAFAGPSADLLATGTAAGSFRLWQVGSGQELLRLPASGEPILGVAFDPGGDGGLPGGVSLASAEHEVRRIGFLRPLLDGEPALDLWRLMLPSPGDPAEVRPIYEASLARLAYELDGREVRPVDPVRADEALLTYYDIGRGEEDGAGAKILAAGVMGPELPGLMRGDVAGPQRLVRRDRVVRFQPGDVELVGNAAGAPVWQGKGHDELLLTPNEEDRVGVALWPEDVRPPFAVEFEYSTYNVLYPDHWGTGGKTAHGLVLFFLKDLEAYRDRAPPAGEHRGLIEDGTGYGLHFRTFGSRRIELTAPGTFYDEQGEAVGPLAIFGFPGGARSRVPNVYTGGDWRHVRVEVQEDGVRVAYAGRQLPPWRGKMDLRYGGLGFGAATGSETSEHRIRRVEISRYVSVEDRQSRDAAPVPRR